MSSIRSCFTSLILSTLYLTVSAQVPEFKVENLNTNNFPELTGVFWARNPDFVDTSKVSFEENGTKVNVHFTKKKASENKYTSKRVVFMLTNGPVEYKFELNKKVLDYALGEGIINKKDKVDIIGFNCTDKSSGEVLIDFNGTFNFTDDVNALRYKLDQMTYKSRSNCYYCETGKTEINYAVERLLTELEKQPSDLPTALIVVGDNNGQRRSSSTLAPGARARVLNVAIYGTAYPLPNPAITGTTEYLAPETYGKFYKTDDINESVLNIKSACSEIIPRSEGVYFEFKYKTNYEKDGQAHTSNIIIPALNGDFRFVVNAPELTALEWVKKNKIISILGLVFFLLIITVIFLLIIQQKRLSARRRDADEKKILDLENRQQQAKSELEEDRRRIEQIKQEQLQRDKDIQREREEEENNKQKTELIRKMKERGNFPWFEFAVSGAGGTWVMEIPEVIVGRTEGNWIIKDNTVSRKHFKVIFNGNEYHVEDLGSSNGIVLNGRKISRSRLQSSDVIEFGNVRATFHI